MTQEKDAAVSAFDRFLNEWSRRDFLRRVGAGVSFSGFLAGGVSVLSGCESDQSKNGPPSAPGDLKTLNPVMASATFCHEPLREPHRRAADPREGRIRNGWKVVLC